MVTPVELSDGLVQQLDALARHDGRSRAELMRAVLEGYLELRAEEDARVEAAIAAADRGEGVDADVVAAEDEAYLLSRGATREQLDAIGAEVRREYEAFYGVSLCE